MRLSLHTTLGILKDFIQRTSAAWSSSEAIWKSLEAEFEYMVSDGMQESTNRLIRLSVPEIPKIDMCPSTLGSADDDDDDDDNNNDM